jgi:hypothetical protein
MAVQLPPCPPQFKTLQHYLKVASEHDQRDPVISYWCKYNKDLPYTILIKALMAIDSKHIT